jgi:broad specificity phosphatase PhoE
MGRLLLVRHGQASFGADDYDVLSDVGHEQSRVLGRRLAASGVVADPVLHGTLARQRDTAASLAGAAGWTGPGADVDARWDEFDHVAVTAAHGAPDGPTADMRAMDRRAFQEAFEQATARWSAGEPPTPGPTPGPAPSPAPEPWAAFVDRVRAALAAAADRAGPGRTALVVSSGGPIALVTALLLGADDAALPAVWARLNTVVVNSGVTTVVVGSTGTRLLTFNAHDHLPPELLTYR